MQRHEEEKKKTRWTVFVDEQETLRLLCYDTIIA